MGTAALSLAFAAQGATWGWSWLTTLASATLILASLLALVLLPRYLGRLADRAALAQEIAHPAMGAMLATLPAGLLVLAAAWGRIGPSMVSATVSLWIDAILLVLGVVIAVTLGLTWSATMLRSSPGLEGVNGGWLIPPVMNLLVPVALSPLIVANPGAAPLLVLIGFAFYGVGVLLFLAVLTLLIARMALRDPLPAHLAASMWIPLAPAGVVGLALIRLLQAATEVKVPGFTGAQAGLIVAAMGIGFGLWWAAFATVELLRLRRTAPLPRHPGWWGFVFPIAAMVLSISAVGSVSDVTAVQVLGLAGTALLTFVWAYVAARTAGLLRPSRAK